MDGPVNKLIYLVANARPHSMKVAPIVRALSQRSDSLQYQIVHTAQHYDQKMSDVFFDELGILQSDHHLECGGGSHAEQTGKSMVAFECICRQQTPAYVLGAGDGHAAERIVQHLEALL